MAHENMKKLTEENFKTEVAKGITLVDFYADWCGPCRLLAPVLDQVAQDVQGKATVAKLDIDQAQQVTGELQITSVPTMILFKDGKECKRVVGLRDADFIKDFVLAVC
jgi:thioredoxin 1